MRGQNTIIRMRLAGYKPTFIFVEALTRPCEKSYFMDPENTIQNGGQPEIQIGSDDAVGVLDLRAVKGTTVLLNGGDRGRLRSVYAQLKKFDPARIIATGDDFFYDSQEGNHECCTADHA